MRICHRLIAPAEIPSWPQLPSSGLWDIVDLWPTASANYLWGCDRAQLVQETNSKQLTMMYTHLVQSNRRRNGRRLLFALEASSGLSQHASLLGRVSVAFLILASNPDPTQASGRHLLLLQWLALKKVKRLEPFLALLHGTQGPLSFFF